MTTSLFRTHSNSLFTILWGIIFAKCFTLEYLVQIYAVPINSAIYIWTLSLSMATAATFVFAKLSIEEDTNALRISKHRLIQYVCAVGILLTTVAGFVFEFIPRFHILAYFALIMGLGYCGHCILVRSPFHALSGFGWCLGAGPLFLLRSNNNLLIFALLIICFSVLPTFIRMSRQHRDLKQNIKTNKS